MSVTKLLSTITCAAALTVAGLAAFAAPNAAAADITATWDAAYYLPGEKATLTASGCPAGATLSFAMPGASEPVDVTVEGDAPVSQSFDIPSDVSGSLGAAVRCAPVEGEETTLEPEAHILGQSLKAVPSQFTLGESVKVSAGEFVPGSVVTLRVKSTDGATTHWSTPMGSAGEGMGVETDVTFPTTLACGNYVVHVSSAGSVKDNTVQATLRLCGSTPTPTPSSSATSPSPTTSASASPSSRPTASTSPKATPTSGSTVTRRHGKPGVPSTGVGMS